jgi:hypothetical protein
VRARQRRALTAFSSVRISGVRKKQLLAINLVVGDGLLALRRYQLVDEHLAQLFLHLRMFVWVHQNDGVLIEHASVAFHQDLKVALVFERNPSAAVGECIAAGGRVLYGAWAFIPRSIGLYQGPSSSWMLIPTSLFQSMSSRIWVPELSPRDMKVADLSLIALSAFATSFMPLIPAGSPSGPISTKSLYMTG